MKIGYSRAARIVDLMEKLGIVGPADGAKPREVLVSEWPPAGSEPDEDIADEEEEVVDEEETVEEDESGEARGASDEETEEIEEDADRQRSVHDKF